LIALIQKSVNEEIAAIEKIIARGENAFRKAFAEYLATIKSAAMLKAIRQFLERNDIEALISHINSAQKPFGKVLSELMLAAGTNEVATLKPKIERELKRVAPKGLPTPVVGIEFEIANPRAAAILQARTQNFIREINEAQRTVINQILTDAQLQGGHPRGFKGLAEEIHSNIGLTARQQRAVANYEKLLRAGSKEALQRDLRDRRFDGTVRRADEKPLTEEQINRMVSAYRSKYERYRADTIARTESHAAVNQARQEALQQSMEQSGIDADEVTLVWRATKDKRTRDQHSLEGGQKVKFGQPFVMADGSRLMHPGDRSLGAPGSQVIGCRCAVTTEIVLRG
jgi:uncharacterized protein with gpF-like domain